MNKTSKSPRARVYIEDIPYETKEEIEEDIELYKKSMADFRTSVGIPKPQPKHRIILSLKDREFDLYNREEEKENFKDNPNENYKQYRMEEYGPLVAQIEHITEKGLDAWKKKVKDIKEKYPKPKG